MSWFGEQFNSFTEKLTDLTRDVLPDSGSPSSSRSMLLIQSGPLTSKCSLPQNADNSPEYLQKLCEEKDAEIQSLLNEKISLERSIEELDLQNQEAINELLHLKNEAIKENAALKEDLALQKEALAAKSLLQKFQPNYLPKKLGSSDNHSANETMGSIKVKDFNLINIIGVLWKSLNHENLSNHLAFLKEQKLLLESQVAAAGDSSVRDVINRINNYIMFLNSISQNQEAFYPIIDEIATVIHFLLFNNGNGNLQFPDPNVAEGNVTIRNTETRDLGSQTVFADFQYVRDLFSMNPQPIFCNNVDETKSCSSEPCNCSQHVQTDGENSVQNCNSLISDLRQYVITLEEEKSELNEHISELETMLEASRSVPSSSVLLQTDDMDSVKECELLELQTYVSILEQEKSDLLEELSGKENSGEKSTSTASIQTDQDDFSKHELQAYVCILEQQIEDLKDEATYLKSIIDKPTSCVEIQTDESLNVYGLLQAEIASLQEVLSLKERDYSDNQEEMTNNINCLKEELKFKESVILEKDSIIHSLENDFDECKSTVNSLNSLKEEIEHKESVIRDNQNVIQSLQTALENHKSSTKELNSLKEDLEHKEFVIRDCQSVIQSLQTALEEHKSSNKELNTLKEELDYKENLIRDSQSIIQSLQTALEEHKSAIPDLNNLKEELRTKESVIEENQNIIQSLESTLDEHKSIINSLNEKINSIKSLISVEIQTDEISCSCKEFELEILELKKSMDEREKEFSAIQNQTIISLNDLKEEIKSKENLISDKETMLKAVNAELEVYENKIKTITKECNSLKDELNSLKESSSVGSKENCQLCRKYKLELEELRFCLKEKEKAFVATQNDFMKNESNLNEVLQSKEILLMDKEEKIMGLKLELEEAKGSIKNYLSDLKVLKAKQDYAKDIDTMEECDIKMIMGNCNKNRTLTHGETNDNDFKNEIKVLQEKLKALDLDRNQLLCVLNEKTQECSSLKAEVHKLTNIVASEKQALFKLQQDNCLLKDSRDNSDPELTKEAIKKLSQIIRDKDLEIESLKQKNGTLTALIQDATSVPDHLQSLIEEKENLTKQINVFKADRDKIMARYNTIDKDCRQYAAEVKKLKSALSEQKEKFDVLEQKHFSVAQQYEEKQKSLINTQNEMIALKQRVTDLEQQQVDIKEKYGELLNKFNSDTVIQINREELDEKNSQIEQLMSDNSEKDHLIQEKDCLILDLSQQIKALKLECEQQLSNLSNLQGKVEDLTSKLKEQETMVEKLQNEKEASELRFQDKSSELGLLKDMNERLNMSVKEKEFTIQSMTEKISSLSHYISSDHSTSETIDINQILADSESLFSKAQSLYKERDETLLALNQSKQENQSLRNEIQRMKSNEIQLHKQLDRLRAHLLEIEENYTAEALKAEEREKELRDELMEMKRRAEISNTAIVDTNQRASLQIASLQEQLSIIANQRDQALAQVSTLEDKVHQHSASVSKLQLVLEQMQRGNERKIKETEKKFNVLLENQKQLYRELEEKLQAKEMQLEESSEALEAATRLSEQLDAKEEIIAHLKNELSKTESKIKSTAQEIDTIKSNTEGKVDRVVMKSLVLGYFSTPPGQKSEVIRLLARVLDFNQEEMEKAGIVVGRSAQRNEQKGLFSSLFSRLPTLSSENSSSPPQKSFTTLFVQFLENESQPIVPMPFPAEKMAHDLSFKQHSNKKSPSTERRKLPQNNPLLLDIDSAFPTFSPVPAVEYSQSPAQSILREVLD